MPLFEVNVIDKPAGKHLKTTLPCGSVKLPLLLTHLDRMLLSFVCPPERVPILMCVNKRLREDIGKSVQRVVMKGTKNGTTTPALFLAAIDRFTDPSVKIDIQLGRCESLCNTLSSIPPGPWCRKIHHLDLSRCGIQHDEAKQLTKVLLECTNLSVLNLRQNEIGSKKGATAVFKALQKCKRLKHLDVYGNSIGNAGAKLLAKAIPHLPLLTHLDIGWNRISSTGMAVLAAEMSKLSDSEGVTGNSSSIETLHVQENDLRDEGIQVLASAIPFLLKLQRINVGWNYLGSEGLNAMISALLEQEDNRRKAGLTTTPGLRTLNMNENQLRGAGKLCELVEKCRDLEELSLGWNNLGDEGLAKLAVSLRMRHEAVQRGVADGWRPRVALCTLDLRSNYLSANGMAKFADELALEVEEGNVVEGGAVAEASGERGEATTAAIAAAGRAPTAPQATQAAPKATPAGPQATQAGATAGGVTKDAGGGVQGVGIRVLRLAGNKYKDKGTRELGRLMRSLASTLVELDLGWVQMNDEGARDLSMSLRTCTKLETLNLCGNQINKDGARHISNALARCKDLKSLNMGGNALGAEGAEAMASMFSHCVQLEEFEVNWNMIGDAGAASFAKALAHAPSLKTLNLGWNKIGGEGARALLDAMQALLEAKPHRCNAFEKCTLSGNEAMGEEGGELKRRFPLLVEVAALAE